MPDEPVKKRVDESWKERAEREKQHTPAAPPPGHPAPGPEPAQAASAPAHEHGHDEAAHAEPQGEEGQPQARFDMFLSSLAMETLIALGDMAHPVTRKKSANLAQAKYLIDLLGVLEEKTAGNLTVDEEQLFKDTLYQLRMRYLAKSGG